MCDLHGAIAVTETHNVALYATLLLSDIVLYTPY